MKHLGDITKISGYEAPIVDVVIGGSPCQDLSVAGKRAGLDGERSGLFMEQIRIVKEMRDADRRTGRPTELIRPRFMLWENVPGALSSNQGEDFRIVLEEIARVKEPNAVIPRPANGKWSNAGCIVGNGWSVAWRILDGQYWGVTYFGDDGMPIKLGTPQRRRRIALVADFATEWGAAQILFERESLSGDIEPSREEGQGTAGDTEEGSDDPSFTLKIRGGREIDSLGKRAGKGALIQTELSGTLGVSQDQTLIAPTIAIEGNGTRESHRGDGYVESDVSYTLNSTEQHGVAYGIDQQGGKGGANYAEDKSPSILSDSHGTPHAVAYEAPSLDTHTHTAFAEKRFFKWEEDEQSVSLRARSGSYGGGSETLIAEDCGNTLC